MKMNITAIVLLIALAETTPALADIFRHEDEDSGVVSFTDTPQSSAYRLIMRDRKPAGNGWKQTIIRQNAASHRLSPEVPATQPVVSNELPVQGVLTSPVGYRADPFDGKLRHHNGYDIAAATGTPVKPVAPGIVVYSGWRGGYGNTVVVEHPDGMLTLYAHNSSNQVSEGSLVDRDTVIALTGSTGRSTGPHLHFEAWKADVNITSSFKPAGGGGSGVQKVASAPIRRYLQEDGTILFTNLR
jgi:murein DD-endopeptidase MepM/ murein hydrolase activator NlpD